MEYDDEIIARAVIECKNKIIDVFKENDIPCNRITIQSLVYIAGRGGCRE